MKRIVLYRRIEIKIDFWGSGLQQSQLAPTRYGLGAVLGIQLAVNAVHVRFNSAHRDDHLGANLLVGEAICQQVQDAEFLAGEWIGQRGCFKNSGLLLGCKGA